MTKEELQLEKRLTDLANAAYGKGIPLFSDFLNLNERSILESVKPGLSFVSCESFGGYAQAERQMAAFLPDAPVFFHYPIACLHITPLQAKFAERLSHRDYLGAILNTGVERGKLGDILAEDAQAFVFVEDRLADYLCQELRMVRHTPVKTQAAGDFPEDYEPRFQELMGTVASLRLDSLLALAFGGSRSSLSGLIPGGKVFVNGRLVSSNGYTPREGDRISVRGMGRFQYVSQEGQSKKGRCYVKVKRYI